MNLGGTMVTSDSSLVIDSTSPYGRVGPPPPTQMPPPSSRSHALFSLSRFRSRLGTEMNEIIPNLFLGSLRDATDVDQLKKHRIQYIVSVHDLTAHHPAHDQLKVLKIQLSDCSSADISAHFAATNQFIHGARLKHAAVLVHCLAGVSRSATVVAAYLMTLCDMSFFNALTFMSRKRPVVNPNFGFRMQLCTYADRNMMAERQRLRELFGPAAFDAQWAMDRAITRSKVGRSSCAVVCMRSDVLTAQKAVTGSWGAAISGDPALKLSDPQDGGTSLQQTAAPLSPPKPTRTPSHSSLEGNSSPKVKPVRPKGDTSAPASHPQPIRKVVARALPLPETMKVQLSSRVHNPPVPEIDFIDD
ncbi:hypothetical protein Y032_0003g1527 [Ancylostoma ceylanicum]|uniref:Dual specificity phosphatase, catalytic domain protein n=2 Tax=Ancylostoma ceylanicum TaxID=53326 RepID=A0A016VY57_9BILA|nr:hypothetical protein Y032_0003g1527 [Ancylostoma ceylanicum]